MCNKLGIFITDVLLKFKSESHFECNNYKVHCTEENDV